MSETRSTFGEALAAHDAAELKAAFNRVNASANKKLHRTTLSRWLEGAVPNSEDVVRQLATELNDDSVLEAWFASRGSRSSAPDGAAVKTYQSLSDEDRLLAYPEIRRLYLESRFPRLLRGLRYRVEINDPPAQADSEHLTIKVSMEYDGPLPAQAKFIVVNTHGQLGTAFEDQACVFRDRVDIPQDRLTALLTDGPEPVLAYNELDLVGQRMIASQGSWIEDGVYRFDNEAADSARVRFGFEYPYPRGINHFPIRFGEFRVAGGAEFTLVLNAASTSTPQAFAFPPAGRHREWGVNAIRPDRELVASIGAGGTILADGDGLVLSWREAN